MVRVTSHDIDAACRNAAKGLTTGDDHTRSQSTHCYEEKKKEILERTPRPPKHTQPRLFLAGWQEQARYNVGFGILFCLFVCFRKKWQ